MKNRKASLFFPILVSLLLVLLGQSCEVANYPFYLARNELNLSLVIDKSGSMGTAVMEDARAAARAVVDILSESDILSIVSFNDSASVDLPSDYVTDKDFIKTKITSLSSSGGTNVSSGLRAGYGEIEKNITRNLGHICILICDGDVDAGAEPLAADAFAKGIYTSAVAVGTGADTTGLRNIAIEGEGAFYHVTNSQDLTGIFLEELNNLLSPVKRGGR